VSTKAKRIEREYREISQLGQEERDQMLMENLPQVRYIARRIHDRLPPHVSLEDLVSAGIVGLLEAIHNFDPGRSGNIKGYAKHRIQGAMLDSLRDLDWGPRELRKKGRRIEEALHKLRTSLGRAPSESELAESLAMSLKELQNLLSELRGLHLGSLQAVVDRNHHEPRLGAAEVHLPVAVASLGQDRHPVTVPQAARVERRGEPGGALVGLLPGEVGLGAAVRGVGRPRHGLAAHDLREVHSGQASHAGITTGPAPLASKHNLVS